MLVVDSSVWIGFFNGQQTPATDALARLLDEGEVRLVMPDLVLFEVLRGFRLERDFRQAWQLFESIDVESTADRRGTLEAARHYRTLRSAGVVVRESIDALVAAFCIERDYALLHAGRDFLPFESRGLKSWLPDDRRSTREARQ